MENQVNMGIVDKFKIIARFLGVIIVTGASLVLFGWAFDIPVMKSPSPSIVEMKSITAASFLLSGLLILLYPKAVVNTSFRKAFKITAVVIALLGFISLIEYIAGVNLYIDELICKDYAGAAGTSHPGRMAPNTALNFLLIGSALLLIDKEVRGRRMPAQCIILVEGIISMLAVLGYVYGTEKFYSIAEFTKMSPYTAFLFFLICMAVLFLRPDRGFMRIFTADSIGGTLARWLIPVAFVVPFVIGWLRILGERAGLYDTATGVSLSVVANISLFVPIFLLFARSLHSADAVRRKAEDETARLNAVLNDRNARLEMVNKEMEAFSYSVSHDLRAPLRIIDGFSAALMEDCSDKIGEQGRDYICRVRNSTVRMGQLIDDMLKLSRVTRGEMTIKNVDLSEMAADIAGELKKSQPERKAEFIIAPGLAARGDENFLKVVLDNLLGNAWKFTSKKPEARIEFGAVQNNGEITYFVRDNGAGFEMAYADKLFAPFQRLHSSAEFPGTGIGLATVQRIVRRHNGRIRAESEPGKGTVFYFTLMKNETDVS